MVSHTNITILIIVPHIFSRLSNVKKEKYIQTYRKIKFGVETASVGTLITISSKELAKDIISSKLKAYGYKSLFGLLFGPFISLVSIPMYVFTYASKFRPIAIAMSEVGSKIIRAEFGLIDIAWLPCDFLLFGMPVSSVENKTFTLFRNETSNALFDVIKRD